MSKSKTLIAVSLLALTGAAFASDRTDFQIPESTATRAEVLADLAFAKAKGEVASGELGRPLVIGTSTASRERIAAEAAEALRLGLIPAGNSNPRMPTAEELTQVRKAGEWSTQIAGTAK